MHGTRVASESRPSRQTSDTRSSWECRGNVGRALLPVLVPPNTLDGQECSPKMGHLLPNRHTCPERAVTGEFLEGLACSDCFDLVGYSDNEMCGLFVLGL